MKFPCQHLPTNTHLQMKWKTSLWKKSPKFTANLTVLFLSLDVGPPTPQAISSMQIPSLDCFSPLTESNVKSLVNVTNASNAFDPMPTLLVFSCLDVLLPVLTQIINLSLVSVASCPSPVACRASRVAFNVLDFLTFLYFL